MSDLMPSKPSLAKLKDALRQSGRDLARDQDWDVQEIDAITGGVIKNAENRAKVFEPVKKPRVNDYAEQINRWYETKPVCASDPKSQIEWLKHNATPALLHDAAVNWNWDWGTDVLDWILRNPKTSFSSVSFQIVTFVGAGSLDCNADETGFIAEVPSRLLNGFYKNSWSLGPSRRISAKDRELYLAAIKRVENSNKWNIPDSSFGPFPNDPPPNSKFVFDDDGNLRVSFVEWKKSQ